MAFGSGRKAPPPRRPSAGPTCGGLAVIYLPLILVVPLAWLLQGQPLFVRAQGVAAYAVLFLAWASWCRREAGKP